MTESEDDCGTNLNDSMDVLGVIDGEGFIVAAVDVDIMVYSECYTQNLSLLFFSSFDHCPRYKRET